MIEGKTKSGVSYKIDAEGLKKIEWKITKTMMVMKTGSSDEQIAATLKLTNLILGGPAGVEAFEDAIAAANGGNLTNEIVLAEYKELINVVADTLKNTESSPTS